VPTFRAGGAGKHYQDRGTCSERPSDQGGSAQGGPRPTEWVLLTDSLPGSNVALGSGPPQCGGCLRFQPPRHPLHHHHHRRRRLFLRYSFPGDNHFTSPAWICPEDQTPALTLCMQCRPLCPALDPANEPERSSECLWIAQGLIVTSLRLFLLHARNTLIHACFFVTY